MDISQAIIDLENTLSELGIPEFIEGLTHTEIAVIALHHLEEYAKANRDELYENIHEGEENE
jgi:hypothetical protein